MNKSITLVWCTFFSNLFTSVEVLLFGVTGMSGSDNVAARIAMSPGTADNPLALNAECGNVTLSKKIQSVKCWTDLKPDPPFVTASEDVLGGAWAKTSALVKKGIAFIGIWETISETLAINIATPVHRSAGAPFASMVLLVFPSLLEVPLWVVRGYAWQGVAAWTWTRLRWMRRVTEAIINNWTKSPWYPQSIGRISSKCTAMEGNQASPRGSERSLDTADHPSTSSYTPPARGRIVRGYLGVTAMLRGRSIGNMRS